MLVYGDVERPEDADVLRRALVGRLSTINRQPPGIARHAALVSAFIAAAELVQGTIDAGFSARQLDEPDAGAEGMALLTQMAALVVRSWEQPDAPVVSIPAIVDGLEELPLPARLTTKLPEGYAFYALYPESYAEAARRSGLPASTRVIGIRSIGAGLSAIVAATLGAAPPLTVRPTGHPFARRIAATDALSAQVLAGNPEAFAVVDEGPGLSGSSFGAVADWLEALGVPRERIHFFPSHAGEPGVEASLPHRQRWAAAARHHVGFEDLLLDPAEPRHRLENWVAELVGPLDGPLQDISGGGWRKVADVSEEVPVAPGWERRKYLANSGGARWLVKFAGLGTEGERKLLLARDLAAAGYGPPVDGLVHGFLVQRWVEGTNLTEATVEREKLVAQLGNYLGFRATLSAPADAGAPLAKLTEMAMYNTREALGDDAAAALETRFACMPDLNTRIRRVEVDSRLHRWEWVVTPGGIIKADALDHARAHDFVGAQDIAWDVAGAVVEHDLTDSETERICRLIAERSGRAVTHELIGRLVPCYLAFQLGAWTMSAGGDAPVTRRYAARLATS